MCFLPVSAASPCENRLRKKERRNERSSNFQQSNAASDQPQAPHARYTGGLCFLCHLPHPASFLHRCLLTSALYLGVLHKAKRATCATGCASAYARGLQIHSGTPHHQLLQPSPASLGQLQVSLQSQASSELGKLSSQ